MKRSSAVRSRPSTRSDRGHVLSGRPRSSFWAVSHRRSTAGGCARPPPLVNCSALAPGHRLHREQLIAALWPDRAPAAGANNLHQALHVARRQFGPDALEAPRRRGRALGVDRRRRVPAPRRSPPSLRPSPPRAAAALYTGPLLPGGPLRGVDRARRVVSCRGSTTSWRGWPVRGTAGRVSAARAPAASAPGWALPCPRRLPYEPTAFIGREPSSPRSRGCCGAGRWSRSRDQRAPVRRGSPSRRRRASAGGSATASGSSSWPRSPSRS